jgi:hypothetical protein
MMKPALDLLAAAAQWSMGVAFFPRHHVYKSKY